MGNDKGLISHGVFWHINKYTLDKYRDTPNALRVILAHEITHAENHHSLKITAGRLALALCGYPLVKKGLNQIATNPNGWAVQISSALLSSVLSNLALRPLERQYEYEADRCALEKLAPLYGADALVEAVSHDLCEVGADFAPYSWYDKLFKVHPHPKDRLLALGMTKDMCQKAVEEAQLFFQKAGISLLFKSWHALLPCADHYEMEVLALDLFEELLFKSADVVNRSCIHQESAKELITFLKESVAQNALHSVMSYMRDPQRNLALIKGFEPDVRDLIEKLAQSLPPKILQDKDVLYKLKILEDYAADELDNIINRSTSLLEKHC